MSEDCIEPGSHKVPHIDAGSHFVPKNTGFRSIPHQLHQLDEATALRAAITALQTTIELRQLSLQTDEHDEDDENDVVMW